MIFKQFFQPKWKHPKESTRLAALSALDTQNDEQIITELASGDPSANVRAAALRKLNNVRIWWQACQQDAEPSIKRLATQKVAQALLASPDVLPEPDKARYIDQFAPEKTLEQLALQEKTNDVKIKLLARINKPQLLEQVYRGADEALQVLLFDLVQRHELLNKLHKFAKGQAHAQIDELLERQQREQQMPVEVAQQCKLVLAKLNALRDKHEYQYVSTQFTVLNNQFKKLELNWLDSDEREQNEQKHTQLLIKLNRHLDALKEEYDAQQQQQLAKQRSVLALANLEAVAEEIANAMALRFDGNEQIQTDWLHAKVAHAKEMLASEDLQPGQELQSQQQELERLFKQVEQLAAYESDVAQMRNLLTQMSALQAPTDLAEFDNAMAEHLALKKAVKEAIKALPKELAAHWQQALKDADKRFEAAVEVLTQQQNEYLQDARKKARDLRRLIGQGRYRVAFGVFNGFKELYHKLSNHYQQQIVREYESLEATLSEAKDWHQYAGVAQQQQLVDAATELAQQSCDDANARLEVVKRLRKSWQLLGPEVQEHAKEQFENAIEQAFEPCREHFAKQQVEKEQALAQRQELIAQMRHLNEQASTQDIVDLERQYNLLIKQWREAKRLDSKQYHKLNKQFTQAQGDIGERITQFYDDNTRAKEALLQQAQQLREEDVFSATNKLKSLQQQWQQLGFAGKAKDRKLWHAFRRVNDDLFALRDQAKEQQQSELDAQQSEQEKQLEHLEQSLQNAQNVGEYQHLYNEAQQLQVVRTLADRKSQLFAQINEHIAKLQRTQQVQHWLALKDALSNQQPIDKQWLSDNHIDLSASQLLIRLEILANIDSPSHEAQLRMQEQVNMLDDKHHGVIYSNEDLLRAWLQCQIDGEGICSAPEQCQRVIRVIETVVAK
ncbi:DUF349 domain-containing protein [Pseudoalteromonas sp. SSDWG2]|uniref:DUF349 domain-containing protein n=1 Tax=Pseudoalteromonas sp. SSDWG2 TaxID=3139391 RepID=UPI003BA984AF